jgi:hypothetical protein
MPAMLLSGTTFIAALGKDTLDQNDTIIVVSAEIDKMSVTIHMDMLLLHCGF